VRIAQEDPLVRAQPNKSLSQKSDAERMGVQGGQVSAQVSKTAEAEAPKIVAAEAGPTGADPSRPKQP